MTYFKQYYIHIFTLSSRSNCCAENWRHCAGNLQQFPTVEECDFDRQFLFDEYEAISHRYLRFKKDIIEKLNNSSFVLCKN